MLHCCTCLYKGESISQCCASRAPFGERLRSWCSLCCGTSWEKRWRTRQAWTLMNHKWLGLIFRPIFLFKNSTKSTLSFYGISTTRACCETACKLQHFNSMEPYWDQVSIVVVPPIRVPFCIQLNILHVPCVCNFVLCLLLHIVKQGNVWNTIISDFLREIATLGFWFFVSPSLRNLSISELLHQSKLPKNSTLTFNFYFIAKVISYYCSHLFGCEIHWWPRILYKWILCFPDFY